MVFSVRIRDAAELKLRARFLAERIFFSRSRRSVFTTTVLCTSTRRARTRESASWFRSSRLPYYRKYRRAARRLPIHSRIRVRRLAPIEIRGRMIARKHVIRSASPTQQSARLAPAARTAHRGRYFYASLAQ